MEHTPYSLIHLFLCVLKQHVFWYFYITFNWNEFECASTLKPWVVAMRHTNSIQILSFEHIHILLYTPSYFLLHIFYEIRTRLRPSKYSMHRWVLSWKFWYALLKYFRVTKMLDSKFLECCTPSLVKEGGVTKPILFSFRIMNTC